MPRQAYEAYGFVMTQDENGVYHLIFKDGSRQTIDAWITWIESINTPEAVVYALYDIRRVHLTAYAVKRTNAVDEKTRALNLVGVFAILIEKSAFGQTLAHMINLLHFRTNRSLAYRVFTDEQAAWDWLAEEQQKRR